MRFIYANMLIIRKRAVLVIFRNRTFSQIITKFEISKFFSVFTSKIYRSEIVSSAKNSTYVKNKFRKLKIRQKV